MISNLEDMSHWVIALINDGHYEGKQVIPSKIIKETLKPGLAFPNTELDNKGYDERLNSNYCMARGTEVYKGHILSKHGGAMPGFHSQVAILPYDSIGIISFVIGDHARPMKDVILYNVVDRLLKQELTDWHNRRLSDRKTAKVASRQARVLIGFDQIQGTTPTHSFDNYVGSFSNEAYGQFDITQQNDSLYFNFRKYTLPLNHYHYNRFDTPNNEDFGKWSLNFSINPQGEIGDAIISMDEGQVIFSKQVDPRLSEPEVLEQYLGSYEWSGSKFEIILKGGQLILSVPGSVNYVLIPYKKDVFKFQDFDDQQIEFSMESNEPVSLKWKDPSGSYELKWVK